MAKIAVFFAGGGIFRAFSGKMAHERRGFAVRFINNKIGEIIMGYEQPFYAVLDAHLERFQGRVAELLNAGYKISNSGVVLLATGQVAHWAHLVEEVR